MKEEIHKTLSKMQNDTPIASSPNSSSGIKSVEKPLGDPNCPHCGGVGYIRYDVPVDHPKFGKLETCVCRTVDVAEARRARLFKMSNLDRLANLTFENFKSFGNERNEKMLQQEKDSLRSAFEVCEQFAKEPKNWLLLEGEYGSGKTHLAAAIANYSVNHGLPTLFITVPDVLDFLRFAYDDPETTFEQRFEEIRNSGLLILDDFGTHNATSWAQEKLFQIVNYRYINKLPTVITTNLMLDEIEGRIRSRLQDEGFVKHLRIAAPDYRRPKEISNPGASMLYQTDVKRMTFLNFEGRDDEVGKKLPVVTVTEKQDRFGNKFKEKEIANLEVTQSDLLTLRKAVSAAVSFSEQPSGWIAFLGQSYCGKTHLAAAIGNHRIEFGGQAMMLDVSGLLDYLRQTFEKNSDVSLNRRMHEIRITPLLILDDLRESSRTSNWSEDKLLSILNYRYYNDLPTVLTSQMNLDAFMVNYSSLCNKFLDPQKSQVFEIDMPPYRRIAKSGKTKKK